MRLEMVQFAFARIFNPHIRNVPNMPQRRKRHNPVREIFAIGGRYGEEEEDHWLRLVYVDSLRFPLIFSTEPLRRFLMCLQKLLRSFGISMTP